MQLRVFDVHTRPDPAMVPVLSYTSEYIQSELSVHDVVYSAPPKLPLDINLEAQVIMHDVLSKQTNIGFGKEYIEAALVPHNVITRPLIKYSVIQKLEAELIVHDVVIGA